MLSSSSVKSKFYAKTFSKNFNLGDSSISLSAFSSRTNLKMNISIIPKLVKKGKTNLNSSKMCCFDCIPAVVLKKCKSELSYVLAKLFNIYLKESCLLGC